MDMVLRMPFLSLNNIDIEFAELRKLTWKLYIAIKALLTTCWIKFINKSEFAAAALDKNSKTFMIYIATLEILITISIHLLRTSLIQDSESTLAAL